MPKIRDLIGMKFGRLTVLRCAGRVNRKRTVWECACSCGGTTVVMGSNLQLGNTLSCGCLRRELLIASKTGRAPERAIWRAIKARCGSPNNKDYPNYGGRGIKVCERWHDYANFIADVGPRPTRAHSLDRINNGGGYEPDNVRWATRNEQANNKRTNRLVDYRAVTMTVADACRAAGSVVSRTTANRRLDSGWSVIEAVETPPLFRRDPCTRKIVGKYSGRDAGVET